MRRRVIVASLVLVLLSAAHAFAVEKHRAEGWANQLATTAGMLKAGSYQTALPILRKLTREILNELAPSDASNYVMVVPLIQTAVAEEGMGDHARAMWDWHMAQTLYPPSAQSDLSMFGEPGAVLKKNLLSDPNPSVCPQHEHAGEPYPTILKHVAPIYPDSARQFKVSGIVLTFVKVKPDGSAAEPRVVKALPGPLTFAALEALGQWKFNPVMINGAPIESDLCVAIKYRLN
jgi:hypothetical protein